MKFSLAKEPLHFYNQNGFVEFEDIISIAKFQQILHAIRKEKFDSTEQHYEKHHDLWRRSPEIKKNLFQKVPASIVADLSEKKPLRVGYDQLIPKGFHHQNPLSLRNMSSIQGVVGGYLLCLESVEGVTVEQPVKPEKPIVDEELTEGERPIIDEEEEEKIVAPFSTQAGNLIFIDPDVAIDFSLMPCDHLLVCFVGKTAVYCHNEQDPHTHLFKEKGYVFGDRIQERELPTVLREFSL
jgi:hypothetical protein